MNILNIIKLSKQLSKFVSIPYADGNLICDGELEVGKQLFIEDASGNLSPAAGEYETDDKIIRVENGIISEILEKEEEKQSDGTEEQTQDLEDETKSESKDNGSVDETKSESKDNGSVDEDKDKDKDKKIAELEAKVAELEAKIAELTSSMNFVKEELAKPVENFSSSKKNQKPLFKTYWG